VEIRHFVSELLRTILLSFSDRVPSVREQAAEACYNVMDVTRVLALPFLGELFVGIGTVFSPQSYSIHTLEYNPTLSLALND
jgi:hypothetical protein